ncbi:MAG: glycoside hydrolase family 3 N-terminal domain-containing protein [Thermoproteota archaeon]
MRRLERSLPAFKMFSALCMVYLGLQTSLLKTSLTQGRLETPLFIFPTVPIITVLTQTSEEADRSRKVIAGVIILMVTVICVYFTVVFITRPPLPPPSPTPPPYRNPNLSPEERALDLLSRMTLDEKIGQMTLPDRQSISSISDISTYNLGGLLSGGGSCPIPNIPSNWAKMYNEYQKEAVEGTRLGIPILYGIDAVHGHNNVYGAVIFPHNVGMGASWNPELVKECARITAIEVRATGIRWTFSPCIDVARDDRWGRTYESFGEDPYLVKIMAMSSVKGYQGDGLDRDDTVLSTAKHYMGSGGTKDGRDQGDFQGPLRILREQHLEPFIGAVDAGVGSVMASYCSINGQKIHGIRFFLTDVLKVELGFKGLLVSDWEAIGQVDPSYRNAVKKCIEAGIDMAMVPSTWKMFQEALKDLVNSGEIPVSKIDEAVYRILLVKFRLGLFENPYVDESISSVVGSAAHREVARQAVRESIVLLKNNGILPIPKNVSTIFVAGPNANDIGNQCGGWTITWQGSSGDITIGTTILEAIRKTVSPSTVIVFDENASNVAGPYDVGIVVVGETPYAEFLGDRENLDLPEEQLKIIDRVVASGTPTVVIMVAGRPLTGIENRLPEWDAFLMAWLPGTEGQGVADVLFGDYNPSGKLSRSWPRSTAQEPINYDRRPGEEYDPLFEFGYGLSYTTFEYSCLNVTPAEPLLTDTISISVNVMNVGSHSGSEVVQVYVSDVESSLPTPVKKLYRFRKITLQPGEVQTVSFTIPVSELGFYTDGPEKTVEEGVFVVTVGGLTASFTARK